MAWHLLTSLKLHWMPDGFFTLNRMRCIDGDARMKRLWQEFDCFVDVQSSPTSLKPAAIMHKPKEYVQVMPCKYGSAHCYVVPPALCNANVVSSS